MEEETPLLSLRPCMFRQHPFRFVFYAGLTLFGLLLQAEAIRSVLPEAMEVASEGEVLFARILGGLLACFGVGKLFFWWTRNLFTRLIVTKNRVTRRDGILSLEIIEMRHENIQKVSVHQSVFQRLLRCGEIRFTVAGQTAANFSGVRDPQRVAARLQSILDDRREGD